MRYINLSPIVKTFYGVEFKPGDIRDVDGYVDDPQMFIALGMPTTRDEKPVVEKPVATETETPPKTTRKKSNKEGE